MAINTLFQNIADAIRERGGTSAALTPAQMPAAIADIQSGIEILSGTSDPTSEIGENGQIYIKYGIFGYIKFTDGVYVPTSNVCNTAGTIIATISGRNYIKVNATPTIVSIGASAGYWQPQTVSTDPDAIKYTAAGGGPWNYSYSYTINGVTWYFFTGSYGWSGSPSVTSDYPIITPIDFSTQANAEAYLQQMGVISNPQTDTIISVLLKVNSSWVDIMGQSISEVNLGG